MAIPSEAQPVNFRFWFHTDVVYRKKKNEKSHVTSTAKTPRILEGVVRRDTEVQEFDPRVSLDFYFSSPLYIVSRDIRPTYCCHSVHCVGYFIRGFKCQKPPERLK